MLRKHGIKIAFYGYWAVYLPILLIYANHWVFDPRVVMSIGELSYGIIPIMVVATFCSSKLGDCSDDYFWLCAGSFCSRLVVSFMKYWGLTNPSYVLLLTVFIMALCGIFIWVDNRDRNYYFED